MIASKDITPEKDYYYLGSVVLDILLSEESQEVDFLDVFEGTRKKVNINIYLFTLTIDWLYLIGAISSYKKGNIVKCF
jgi:hypothetical protein